MNERVKDEQDLNRPIPVDGPTTPAQRAELHGIEVRIDAAHAFPIEPEVRDIEWQNLDHFVPPRSAETPSRFGQPASPNEPSQNARWLASQHQAQLITLEQREQAIRLRQSALDDEKQKLALRISNEQTQVDARKAQLQKNETTFAERLIAFEVEMRKFELERSAFHQARAELDRQRIEIEGRKVALREEVRSDLLIERKEVDLAKSTLQKDIDHAKVLKDTLNERLNTLTARNEEVLREERETLWQSLTEEWEQRKLQFETEQESWAKTRDLEESDLDRERAIFEAAVESADGEFLKARQALDLELNELREKATADLEARRREWHEKRLNDERQLTERSDALQAEIVASREALIIEIAVQREQHRSALDAERTEWEQVRQRQEAGLLAEREAFQREIQATLQRNTASWQSEQDQWQEKRNRDTVSLEVQRAELRAALEALEAQTIAARQRHESMLIHERTEWEQTRDREREFLEAQKAEWAASRDSMLSTSREALEVEFIGLRESHATRLTSERQEWQQTLAQEKAALEEQTTDFVREQNLIENRIRFQQDHLDKTRSELEQAQNEYRRERQVERQRLEELQTLTNRRMKQVDLYRSSIDAREKSLDRELDTFNRTRKAVASTADIDRLNLQVERDAWEQERQIQQNDLRRQHEALVTRTESLESRRLRLDKLRTELEETHRSTLEMRLAVEESWAQLTRTAGQDDARQRVEQVRQALVGYYQQLHQSLAEQRREHQEAQSKLERLRTEFAEERQKLTAWITKRDEGLRQGEERLQLAAVEATTNHAKWLAARDRWLLEKTEAEHLIRRLLTSLGENNREQFGPHEPVARFDESQRRLEKPLMATS